MPGQLRESIVQDVRYAVRTLIRAPLFTASVAGTIGLGLGILCSAFTIFNAFLFKTVDLPDPYQLYRFSWDTKAAQRPGFSFDDFEELTSQNPVLAHAAAGRPVTVSRNGAPMFGHLVTSDYFNVTRASMALGRSLAPSDFSNEHSGVLVLSHQGWRTNFNADPSIVGKEITLAGARFVVIGVAQAGATLPNDEVLTFWTPMTMRSVLDRGLERGSRSLFVVGRSRPDVRPQQVHAWFDAWLRQRFPAGSTLTPTRIRVDSLATRIPRNQLTLVLFSMLTAAFGLVLVVAAANVTNMLLARGLGRQRELGMRLSLGATRARLVRQLLIESLVLAGPAAIVGLALTWLTAKVFPALITSSIPAGAEIAFAYFDAPVAPDLRVLALLIAAVTCATLLVGLSPALQLTRASLLDAIRGQLGSQTRISRVRSAFVAVQVTTCVLFLVAAVGIVTESRRMSRDETGVDYDRVLSIRTPPDLRVQVAEELMARTEVEHVAAAWQTPLRVRQKLMRVTLQPESIEHSASLAVVSPDYFDTMGVVIRRGRPFTALEATADAPVVVVSESTARLFWPNRDPMGQVLALTPSIADTSSWPRHARVTVIGVAADAVNGTLLDGVADATLYFPTTTAAPQVMSLLVRLRGDAAAATRQIGAALEAAHPAVPLDIVPLRLDAAIQVWSFRAFSTAAAVPAVTGLLLAFAGTYGVVAFIMTQRTREFGIRLALGAKASDIVRMVLQGSLRTAIVAVAAGVAAAAGLMRAIAAMTNIAPSVAPSTYLVCTGIVLLASTAASLLPALRAIRLNPSSALRSE